MANPRVSIIVPMYNSANTIEVCVASIVAQTVTDWELILADNNSTDDTANIIRALADSDSRIRTIYVPQKGVASARNAALDIAQGDYIAFVDSDDTVDPDYLEKLLCKDADLVVCGYFVDSYNAEKESVSTRKCCPIEIDFKTDREITNEYVIENFKNGFFHICCNKLYKRSIIEQNQLRFDHIPVNEDFQFILEFLLNSRSCTVISNPLYHWIRVEGIETGVSSNPDNILAIYNNSHKLLRRLFTNDETADLISYYSYQLILHKYFYLYKTKRLEKKELAWRLKEFNNNYLIRKSVSVYNPISKGDIFLHFLIKKKLLKIYFLVQSIISN